MTQAHLAAADEQEDGESGVATFKPEEVRRGYFHEEFKEVNEVMAIIDSLPGICEDQIALERAHERFLYIIDKYQVQPHLLDPHLEKILKALLDIGRNLDPAPVASQWAFKLMYIVTKARGYKVIVRLLPHEVVDMEPVLTLISKQILTDHEKWESRYMLLLWLAIVSIIPFDMHRFDGTETTGGKLPIMDRVMNVGKTYLSVSDKCRDAAAYMLSRFVMRPDAKLVHLNPLLDWMLSTLSDTKLSDEMGKCVVFGILRTLSLMLKYGKREDLIEHASPLLKKVLELSLKDNTNTLLRKLNYKVIQRIGLTFLKARVTSWRYQRGNRCLLSNLGQDIKVTESTGEGGNTQLHKDDEDYDIPEETEEVLEQLLNGLRDKDTVVRWSAAKGIGRVTGRLPKELADDVVGSIMELFSRQETDAAWHGGCLALAELGRRGLLLPSRLQQVVPVIVKALNYDEKRGNFSVGAHVRDAACYVCWAFARAYDPVELKPFVQQIANALVIVFVFDREVNVRRAASAAFQENVGRQGQFPHGIEILTTCDYFAVGMRPNCYQELSLYVAQFPEYTRALIDHLYTVKISHWDMNLRELTAKSMRKLTAKDPDYFLKTVLPKMVETSLGQELNLRHGSILAVGQIVRALAAAAGDRGITEILDSQTIEALRSITTKLYEAKLFKGMGGELMRKAACVLIQNLSKAKMPFHGQPIIEQWHDLIDNCLEHAEPDVQLAAVAAIPDFFSQYYQTDTGDVKPDMQAQILDKYLNQLHASTDIVRIGYCLALGVLPEFVIHGRLNSILAGLLQASRPNTELDMKWAEVRCNAIKAMHSVCTTVGFKVAGPPTCCFCPENLDELTRGMLKALEDYTLDSRGDVGAGVREASMLCLQDLFIMIVKVDPTYISQELCQKVFCALVQQSCEKIDRTRAISGQIFFNLLHHVPSIPHIPHEAVLKNVFPNPSIPHIPHEAVLKNVFPKNEAEELNWSVPSLTFPRFVQLISLESFAYSAILGFTVSVGGLTESLVKSSSASLLSYLHDHFHTVDTQRKFANTILDVFTDFLRVDRVSVPLLKMLDQLLVSGCFDLLAQDPGEQFIVKLLELCKQEIKQCGDPQKLLVAIDVFSDLLQFPLVRSKSLSQLLILMCHKYPIVRRTSASKLYEAVIVLDELVSEQNQEQVMSLLADTQWDQPVADVRPIRNDICTLMDIPQPVLLAGHNSPTKR